METKCIYKNEHTKQNCERCDSKICEMYLRKKGIYYSVNSFIQFVKKKTA